jgi:hypothetical protein
MYSCDTITSGGFSKCHSHDIIPLLGTGTGTQSRPYRGNGVSASAARKQGS